mmetsp:Transcript_52449/g.139117  ORF Transcript_52449/g.139117 Transcript_52449/m.139117 type:complete len:210 (-) Transcript_52449:28-657(-)
MLSPDKHEKHVSRAPKGIVPSGQSAVNGDRDRIRCCLARRAIRVAVKLSAGSLGQSKYSRTALGLSRLSLEDIVACREVHSGLGLTLACAVILAIIASTEPGLGAPFIAGSLSRLRTGAKYFVGSKVFRLLYLNAFPAATGDGSTSTPGNALDWPATFKNALNCSTAQGCVPGGSESGLAGTTALSSPASASGAGGSLSAATMETSKKT